LILLTLPNENSRH